MASGCNGAFKADVAHMIRHGQSVCGGFLTVCSSLEVSLACCAYQSALLMTMNPRSPRPKAIWFSPLSHQFDKGCPWATFRKVAIFLHSDGCMKNIAFTFQHSISFTWQKKWFVYLHSYESKWRETGSHHLRAITPSSSAPARSTQIFSRRKTNESNE